jgi:hypothetical protein
MINDQSIKLADHEDQYKECPYNKYGDSAGQYDIFYCYDCTMNVCEFCLLNCHKKDCLKSKEPPEPYYFYNENCECGKDGHINSTCKGKIEQCNIGPISDLYPLNKFICETCGKDFCTICFFACHPRVCENPKLKAKVKEDNYDCCCSSDLHDNNRHLFRVFDSAVAEKHYYICRSIFVGAGKGLFNNYFSTVKEIIHKNLDRKNFPEYPLYEEDLYQFTRIVKMEVKHFFYFPDDFRQLFPYETIKRSFLEIKHDPNRKVDDISHFNLGLKLFLPSMITHTYLRSDFKMFKKMSIHYYQNTSIVERMKMRFLIHKEIENDMTRFAKYKFNDKEDNYAKYILHMTGLMTSYRLIYNIAPFVKIALKLPILETDELRELIKQISKLPFVLENYVDDEYENKTKMNLLCLIALNYNDSLVYDYIMGKKTSSEINFLHKSENGEGFLKIFMPILRDLLSTEILDDKSGEKTNHSKNLTKYKEVIRLFTFSENSFSKDLENFERIDNVKEGDQLKGRQEFENFKKLYENLNAGGREKAQFVKEINFGKIVYRMIQEIENECMSYYFSFDPTFFIKLNEVMTTFSVGYNDYLDEHYTSQDPNCAPLSDKQSRHFDRVLKSCNYLKFIRNKNFYNHLNVPNFVEVFKIYSFIRTIFLIIESADKACSDDYKEKAIQCAFDFLSIFTTSKRCLEYLISNNVIKKIHKLSEKYRARYLELVYHIIKGLSLFKIEIQYKESLQMLTKDILTYFLKLEKADIKMKTHAILILKIFYLISEHLDFNQMKDVRRSVFKHLQECSIFTYENFKNTFTNPEKHHLTTIKQGLLNNDTQYMVNRQSVKERLSAEFVSGEVLKPSEDPSQENKRRKTLAQLAKYKFLQYFNTVIPIDNNGTSNEQDLFGHKTNIFVDQKIFFSFFKLISHNTFYVLKNDSFKECIDYLHQFNNLNFFHELMSSKVLSLDKRTILIKYLYSIYFLDIVGDKTTNQNLISSQELSKYLKYKEQSGLIERFKNDPRNSRPLEELRKEEFKKEDFDYYEYREVIDDSGYEENLNNLSKEFTENGTSEKYEFTKNFMKAMGIFIHEVDNLFYWIYFSKDEVKDIKNYVQTLLKTIRFIADFFWDVRKKNENMFAYLITLYYKLEKVLTRNIGNIKILLETFSNKPDDICSVSYGFVMNHLTSATLPIDDEQGKEFDKYFDISKIYNRVLTGLSTLNLDVMRDAYIKEFFHDYDFRISQDYFTVGIVFDGEYVKFYQGLKAKEVDDDNIDFATSKLYQIYKAQFKQINDTNIFTILSNLSTDLSIREGIAKLFIDYISNDIFIDEHFEDSILILITKLFYYETSKFQEILSNLLQDKEARCKFFYNYYNRAQTCISIYTSTCDKFYTHYRYSVYMNMKTKLMLQLIQLLGEGFYKGFSDVIFNDVEVVKKEGINYDFYKIVLYDNIFEYKNIMDKIEEEKKEGEQEEEEEDKQNLILEDSKDEASIEEEKEILDDNEIEVEVEEKIVNKKSRVVRKSTKKMANGQQEEGKLSEEVKEEEEVEEEEEKEDEAEENKEEEKKEEEVKDAEVAEKKNDEEAKPEIKEEEAKPEEKITINIYKHFYDLLIHVNNFFMCESFWKFDASFHLSDDHLLIFMTNVGSLIIEYTGNYDPKYDTNSQIISKITEGMDTLTNMIFKREKHEIKISEIRRKIILFTKIKNLAILMSLVQNRHLRDKLGDKINTEVSKVKLFEEIIYYITGLYPEQATTGLNKFDKFLLKQYVRDKEFQNKDELKFCIEAFKFVKLVSAQYSDEMIEYFDSINPDEANDKNDFNLNNLYYDSKCGYKIYQFFNKIISFVTLANDTNEEDEENQEEGNADGDNKEEGDNGESAVEEKKCVEKVNTIYFLKPPFAFLLSDQTKTKFLEYVDRTSATTKIKELIDTVDYFVFEMFYNAYRFSLYRPLEMLNNIQMYYFELFNYLFVLIHQFLLFSHFYRRKTIFNADDFNFFNEHEKFSIYLGNDVLSIIQIFYLGIIIAIWFLIFAKLNYQKLIMKEFDINFVVSTAGERRSKYTRAIRFTNNFIEDNSILLNNLNNDVPVWKKIRIIFLDLILLNREVNFFIMDIVLLILYLASGNSICLVIPVILITNLSSFLYDIMYVIQFKWKQLTLVIMYTFLLIYLFTWIAFLYIHEIFIMETFDVPSVSFLINLGPNIKRKPLLKCHGVLDQYDQLWLQSWWRYGR